MSPAVIEPAKVALAGGFTWTTVAVTVLNLLVGGVLITLLKTRAPLRKLANERESNLLKERAEEMASMRERIERLEQQQDAKDAAHASEVKELERQLVGKDRIHAAERAVDRHRINNLNQAFASLLLLLKKGVSVEDAVAEVEAMRVEQLEREAQEAATIRAAAIQEAGQ